MMLNHNPSIVDDDETAVPCRSSKTVTKTTERSFGRMMARVGAGLLLLLLVAEGAIVLPEEEKKGALSLHRGSFSPSRRTTAQRVVGADRAATAAAEEEKKGALSLHRGSFSPVRRTTARRVVGADRAATAEEEEEGVVVTEDGFDGAGNHESSVMTQRKIAKGSKKNPSLLFHEEVRVSLVAPKEIEMPDLKAKLAEVVLGILNEERRGLVEFTDLDPLRKKIYSFAVQITGMMEEECEEKYSKAAVRCHKAIVMIKSKEAFKDHFSKLKELLNNVLDAQDFVLYPADNKGAYPYVTITNKTPYPYVGFEFFQVPPKARREDVVFYRGNGGLFEFCSPDEIKEGIAAGQTWSATSRGVCLVTSIHAKLSTQTGWMVCATYRSSGTSYSQFYIIMNGANACCVQSSHESGVCDPRSDCVLCDDGSTCCNPDDGYWNSFCPGCASDPSSGDCALCGDGSSCCYGSDKPFKGGGWNSACPGCAF